MPKRTYNYRELIAILKDFDAQFVVYVHKGKGSHRMLTHPDVNGRPVSYPLVCHNEGDDIRTPYIVAIIRRFNLPPDLL
jgi:predicted RNA binding protein YcfA (HicA-like mRNA interferase family)